MDTRYVWRVRVQATLAPIALGTNQLESLTRMAIGQSRVLSEYQASKRYRGHKFGSSTGEPTVEGKHPATSFPKRILPSGTLGETVRSVEAVHRNSAKCS